MKNALSSEDDTKVMRKIENVMSGYSDDFKSELLGYNLVTKGACSVKDLWENMDYEDVVKCTEALLIQSEIESIMVSGGK